MAKPKLALIFNLSVVAMELLGGKKLFKYKNDPSLFAENVYEKIKYEDIIKNKGTAIRNQGYNTVG